MKNLAFVLLFIACAAQAQQVSQEEQDARLQAMNMQRNILADTEVVLRARLIVLEAELKKAKEAVCKPEPKK